MRNPYPHELAVRVQEPDPRKFSRIRRQNDKFGKGIDALWGVLRRKIGNKKTELQAVRFRAGLFTPAMVRKWVDAHGGRGLKIEKATRPEEVVGEVYRGNPISEKPKGNENIYKWVARLSKEYGYSIGKTAVMLYERKIITGKEFDFIKSKEMNLNPMSKVTTALRNFLKEEQSGIAAYKKFLARLPQTAEYSGIRNAVAEIIADEEKHEAMLLRMAWF